MARHGITEEDICITREKCGMCIYIFLHTYFPGVIVKYKGVQLLHQENFVHCVMQPFRIELCQSLQRCVSGMCSNCDTVSSKLFV